MPLPSCRATEGDIRAGDYIVGSGTISMSLLDFLILYNHFVTLNYGFLLCTLTTTTTATACTIKGIMTGQLYPVKFLHPAKVGALKLEVVERYI